MKSKVTNTFLLLAFIFGALTLIFSLIIYLGPQDAFIRIFNGPAALEGAGKVIDWFTIAMELIVLVCYFIVFLVFARSKSVSPAFVVGLIMLIAILTIKLISPVTSILATQLAARQSARNLAVFSSLSTVHSWISGPFSLLALVFYSMGFGSMCVSRKSGSPHMSF